MHSALIQYICLILIILALVMLANRLRLAYPIVLVLGGLALSFTSAFSNITIDPDMVFLIFLPPLLYEAAWQVSWKEFWKWKRVIISFAFPIVFFTSCVIAVVSHALIPGFTLALGFLLGGIISPPDAISATTVMKNVKVPRSLVSIIEGESLLNDASSLIVFRFAMAAIITGQFAIHQAIGTFFLVVVMGIGIGLAVAMIFYAIHRWLPVTPSMDVVLSILAPYCMYYVAEHFHFSGVLAVVSGGLMLSYRRQTVLSYESRIQGINVWNNLVFVLNGIIFMLIGLQLPIISKQMGDIGIATAIGYGLAISATVIITRLLCAFGASVFTRIMSRFITVADNNPGWKAPMVLGWSGMRGVVSLAAALSIPLLAEQGQPFPYRNLILFITFVVILVTLVFQGLTLPWIIRKVNLEDRFSTIPPLQQELVIQKKISLYTLKYLDEHHQTELKQNEHLQNLRQRLEIDLKHLDKELQHLNNEESALKKFQQIYPQLLEHQRRLLNEINHKSEFDEELIRKYLSIIDLEEIKLREKQISEAIN